MGIAKETLARNDETGVIIQRQMTLTHADFFRLLPKALEGIDYTVAGDTIHFSLKEAQAAITLSPETGRTIGALDLPLTNIRFVFDGVDEETIREFFERFDLAYRNGGG